jgi:hypothetical protein
MTGVDGPRCGAVSQERTLEGQLGRVVTIDLCERCHDFWFDGHESLQLGAPPVRAIASAALRWRVLSRC